MKRQPVTAMRCSAVMIALVAGLTVASPVWAADAPASAATQDSVRKALGAPVLAAQAALQEQRWADVLTQLAATDAVSDKTDYENFVIARMRGIAALSLSNLAVADTAWRTVLANQRTSEADAQRFSSAMANESFRNKDYERALTWIDLYKQRGGADAQVLTLRADALYLLERPAQAATVIEEELKGVAIPPKARVELLASSYIKAKDQEGYRRTLARMIALEPKPAYWADLIQRTESQDSYAMRLNADGCRLRRAVGALMDADDHQYCAQVLLDAGSFTEALSVLNASPAGDVKTAQMLRTKLAPLARDEAAEAKRGGFKPESPAARVHVGWLYVTNGQQDKGLALMKQGIDAAAGVKNEQSLRLRYAEGLVLARRTNEARAVLEAIDGTEGEKALARLWQLHLQTTAGS